mmetsp:Transcript_14099/g.34768  ORF Transcript_14099/g.34768 Transcript_14099/m.34768 type:complete len:256 (-) Transcript_14099:16-783(-)
MRRHPVKDGLQELVLLARVISLGHVDQVGHGLGGEQHVVVQALDVLGGPVAEAHVGAALQQREDAAAQLVLLQLVLLQAARAQLVDRVHHALDALNVLEPQLGVDDLQVGHRVHAVLHVDHVRVLERSAHVEDAVHGGDVRQERVAQALALGRALDQARNVPDLQVRRHRGLGLVQVAQPLEALVGHVDTRLVGLNGTEGEVLSWDAHPADSVEQGGLSNVRQTHNTHLEVLAEAPQKGALLLFLLLLGCHSSSF